MDQSAPLGNLSSPPGDERSQVTTVPPVGEPTEATASASGLRRAAAPSRGTAPLAQQEGTPSSGECVSATRSRRSAAQSHGEALQPRRGALRAAFFLLVAGNVVLWLVPDNVAELVARDHLVWLGRFSGSRMFINLGITTGSALAVFIASASDPNRRRRRFFRVAVSVIMMALVVLAADFALRLNFDWPYALGPMAYHRPVSRVQTGVFFDRPLASLSYPNVKPGYPDVPWTLTTDATGFRNTSAFERADVVALGDSFSEGSIVSDDQVWTARFARQTGLSVYNLGMHGYAPQHYLAALKEHGLKLSPRTVVLLFYEGNDFRSARLNEKPFPWWALYVRSEYSPFLRTLTVTCHRSFGHWGADAARKKLDVLSWLPVGVPEGPNERFYAFPPSFLMEHFVTTEEFTRKSRWRRTREVLAEIQTVCKQAGAKLLIAYIPTKAHVVLPLVADRLPSDKVHAFAMLQAEDVKLPDASSFLPGLLNRLDVMEESLTGWCREKEIELLSLTKPMREAVAQGRQTYYTYDDHWTPVGHDIAATTLAAILKSETDSAPPPTTPQP